MTAETILYIVIAAVISLALTLFMYGYKSKYATTLRWIFGGLRFLTLFSILVLLINPKFRSETYTIEKPKLPVLVDNSASVKELGQETNVTELIRRLKENSELNKKFELSFYTFGSDFSDTDSLSFSENNTNISKALTTANQLFKNVTSPLILITDGNQTLGNDYEFSVAAFKDAIYPVILGDSTKYTDLKIEQLNTNRYAFLKNKFPVEVILTYSGVGTVNSEFVITQGATVVHREAISFSESNNAKTLSLTLPASSVGLQKFTAQLIPLSEEKNKVNNSKQFAVEVIDQATNVLIVSEILHPDLGALKKAITTNEQRTVTLKKPTDAVSGLHDFQLIILYQPNRTFASVFQEIDRLKKNTFVISGLQTDWNFLNSIQNNYNKEVTNQTEYVSCNLNPNYGTFAVTTTGFDGFRPLQTLFGGLEITLPHEVMLEQYINGISSESAMLATMELNGKRDAIWDGEGLWKWRAESYLDHTSFQEFDDFIGKLIQYLASNKRRSRLEVNSESFYYNNSMVRINAQFFDQNYVFDARASLNIQITNTQTSVRMEFPLLLRNNFYEVDLNSLPAGEYRYTVTARDEAISRSGSFTILDFNVEQQFLNANVTKLNSIATHTNGRAFFISESNGLIETLLENDQFQPIQKSEEKVVPLIDWKYLLAFIVLVLASEWFIRKYNGLI